MRKLALILLALVPTLALAETTVGPATLRSEQSDVNLEAASGRGIYGAVGNSRVLSCTSSTCTIVGISNSGELIFSSATPTLRASTADAADNSLLCLTAGGACDAIGSFTRGGKLIMGGNENGTNSGQALLHGGGVVQLRSGSGGISLRTDGAQTIDFLTNGTQAWSIGSTGTFIGSGTASIGWAVVDGTDNTACTTQCVAPAVFGFNLAAGATAPVIVGPSDATADICFCAGAS